jgi:hypothetical protein
MPEYNNPSPLNRQLLFVCDYKECTKELPLQQQGRSEEHTRERATESGWLIRGQGLEAVCLCPDHVPADS